MRGPEIKSLLRLQDAVIFKPTLPCTRYRLLWKTNLRGNVSKMRARGVGEHTALFTCNHPVALVDRPESGRTFHAGFDLESRRAMC